MMSTVVVCIKSRTEIKRNEPLLKLKSNVFGFVNLSSNGSNFRTRGENGSTASSTIFAVLSYGPGNELAA